MKHLYRTALAIVAAITICVSANLTYAEAFRSVPQRARNPMFSVPAKLKPRVDFWIDVFTRYGKRHIVFHHRNFPQATFLVVNYARDIVGMTDGQIDRHKKKLIKKYTAEIKAAMTHLGKGKAPVTKLQQTIKSEMAFMPGGVKKYQVVVKEGLIRTQTGIKEKYADAIVRSGRYLHIIEKIFTKDFGLPIELTRLPFIESSFDYKAYSSVGAAGIWQFMPRTARSYMKVNSVIDERRDIVSATRGAAKYLTYAYEKLGSWPLALTSYNHGVAGVGRRVKKAGTRDLTKIIEHPTVQYMGFASTNFYPEFLAALEVYDDIQGYFPGLKVEAPRHFAQVKLQNSVSVRHVQSKLGVDLDSLKELNYAVSSRVWNGAYRLPYGYVLKVPPEYGAKLASLKSPEPGGGRTAPGTSSIYGGTVYKVRRGDTLSKIARRYRTSVSRLRALNGLKSDMLRVGELLVVKQGAAPTRSTISSGGSKYYTVRSGDTMGGIARSFGTSVTALLRMNGLHSSRIQVGQRLRVGAAPTQTATSSARPTTSSGGSTYYTVRSGDTMSGVARNFGTSVTAILRMNGLRTSRIRVGQRLRVGAAQAKSTTGGSAAVVKSSGGGVQYYTVRRGDTLYGIARKHGTSIAALKRLNGFRGSTIKVGQKIKVNGSAVGSSSTGATTYRVRSGDSLWSISKKFRVSIPKLKRANNLRGNTLRVGQVLKLP